MKKLSLSLLSLFLFPIFIYANSLTITGGTTVNISSKSSSVSYGNNSDYGISVSTNSTLTITAKELNINNNLEGIKVINNSSMTANIAKILNISFNISSNNITKDSYGVLIATNSYVSFDGNNSANAIFYENFKYWQEEHEDIDYYAGSAIYITNNSTFSIKNFQNTIIYNNVRISTYTDEHGQEQEEEFYIGTGIELNNGTLLTDVIGISQTVTAIQITGNNNHLEFNQLNLNENDYGIFVTTGSLDLIGGSISMNENSIGIYAGINSAITIQKNCQLLGEDNYIFLQADEGGTIKIENDLKISSNTIGLSIQGGSVTVKKLELSNNETAIEIIGKEGYECYFDFKNLKINENEYGIHLSNGVNFEIKEGEYIQLSSNTTAAIYVTDNSTITINGSITGQGNEKFLMADSGGYININKDIVISSNIIGMYAMGIGSVIQTNNVTITESTTAIKIENGGTIQGRTIQLINNEIAAMFERGYTKFNFSEIEIANKNYGYGLIVSNGGNLVISGKVKISSNTVAIKVENAMLTAENLTLNNNEIGVLFSSGSTDIRSSFYFEELTANKNEYAIMANKNADILLKGNMRLENNSKAAIMVSSGARISISSGEVTGTGNNIFVQAIAGGTIEISSININSNKTGLYVKGDNSLITLSTATVTKSTTAIKVENGGKVTGKYIYLSDNLENDLFMKGEGVSIEYENLLSIIGNNKKYAIYIDSNTNATIGNSKLGQLILNSNDVGLYVLRNSIVTMKGVVSGKNNNVFMQALNGGTIKIENDLKISSNTTGLYVKDDSLISIANGNISYSTTAIKIENGAVNAYNLTLTDNDTGIFINGSNSKLEYYNYLTLNENKYGVVVASDIITNVEIGKQDGTLDINNSKIAGVYAAGGSAITINSNITGSGNKFALQAENNGTIISNNNIAISGNSIGLYAKYNGSIVANGEVSVNYSTTAIKLESGTITGNSITANYNGTAVLISGSDSNKQKITNMVLNWKKGQI